MSRRRSFNRSDPTATRAIGNVSKQAPRRAAPALEPQQRKTNPHAAALAGLLEHEAQKVIRRALYLAGNDINAITAEHIHQARVDLQRVSR